MSNMHGMQKYLNIINESQMIREYGDIQWNWFTNDKRIFSRAWMKEGIPHAEVKQFIAELEAEAGPFEEFWHPLEGYIPGGSDSRQLKKMIAQLGAEQGEMDDDPDERMGDESINVMVLIGDRYQTTGLDGAVTHSNLAVWYGDSTTWL